MAREHQTSGMEAADDSMQAARQLKSSLRQSIGEDNQCSLPRSSSKRKLSVVIVGNLDTPSAALSETSRDDILHGDSELSPIYDQATPPKRFRSNDWPLTNNTPILTESHAVRNSNQPSLSSRRGRNGPDARYSSAISPGRRSRFKEGSMRDRISVKPPPEFTGELENSPPYCGEEEYNRGGPRSPYKSPFSHLATKTIPQSPLPAVTRDDSNTKEPGIVRFGKKFASAFRFSGVFHNVSEIWKGPQDENKPPSGPEICLDRKARAEKAYADLKASGYPGTRKETYSSMNNRARTASPVKVSNSGSFTKSPKNPLRENLRIASDVNKDLPPPPLGFERPIEPIIRSTRSFNSVSPRGRASTANGHRTLPKQSSMRDLLKKEKLKERLTRKVSKLEEEWEKAQKELRALSSDGEFSFSLSSLSPGRGRRKFVPGRLPSLPSERLLQTQVKEDEKKDQVENAKRTIKTDVPSGPSPLRRSSVRINRKAPIIGKRKSSIASSSSHEYYYSQDTDTTDDKENIVPMKKLKEYGDSCNPPTRVQPPRKAKTETNSSIQEQTRIQNSYKMPISNSNTRNSPPSTRLRSKNSQNYAFTATPGLNGVPPVPPLPEQLANDLNRANFQWPDECF
ncbi:hypothetical protein LOY97_002136 [Ophidiomyces ophidiicola]|uniref:uncharacterized protein n=1 Tax=Ophidiomyces ophidiicola TaxID=1387563 RepID=UPI0020C26DCD|nr:uncharacterized protein LOZ57_004217 [Ophidiomyces ophidiicola]KAI1945530.1 hypothetical protein LOZ57_004217 [Ophidiomyces ophidiicola]KAI2011111.1 hypothetical protein LOZ49_003216 [Ophidiomyces ophidiicola]KAI2014117.1 hypothetical protein LOZ46_005631 [Ophidiomyces ophidiicola]KAI2063267.1 hypothetical protein LOZ43_000022 [Ophidiomyces ophidiicola]KAI2133730.1 hypothetical protein LOZ29_004559 [Ophidiomyces ophidiicola]